MTRTLNPLTEAKIREIRRLRAMGREYKTIARIAGCTPEQAVWYWRTRKGKLTLRGVLARQAKAEAKELIEAKAWLKMEIAAARAEMASTAPYRNGVLAW